MSMPDNSTWPTTALAVAQPVRWRALAMKLCDHAPVSARRRAAFDPAFDPVAPQWAYFLWADPVGDLHDLAPTEWGVVSAGSPIAEIRALIGDQTPLHFVSPGRAQISTLLRMLHDIGDVPACLQPVLERRIAAALAAEQPPRHIDAAFHRFLRKLT
ncbi:hypothetical protein LRH25_07055 [Ideonella azotifigens]|uniref:Uncharacterized protein n=1 Tax=Ideonella azotifigens TaxID=513160 RepID=A0ABN1JPX0_9BURK|nr:hypothetical protein [Ideonella azotifigens]MCD2340099.1 hypothetical protein [Ideonella azotifigens]